jgi:hypothetical protein
MSKRNKKKQASVIQVTQVRVPYAIRHGLIEGYSFPYIEQARVENQAPQINVNSSEDDPITYYKETSGSGLFAIRSLKS